MFGGVTNRYNEYLKTNILNKLDGSIWIVRNMPRTFQYGYPEKTMKEHPNFWGLKPSN